MKLYVLIGERGEYDSFTREVLGIFSSERQALDSIPEFKALNRRQWELYLARDKARDEYLRRFVPSKVLPPSSPFPQGCTLYTNEQYEEADKFVGPRPNGFCEDERYLVEPFNLDSVEPPTV